MSYTYDDFSKEFNPIKNEFEPEWLSTGQWLVILCISIVPRLSTKCLTYMVTRDSMYRSHWSPEVIEAVNHELFERLIFIESETNT